MDEIKILNSLVEIQVPENCIEDKIKLCRKEGRLLNVKLGFDPTAPDLHLGHSVVLKKLKQFQDFGHNVIIIIGDYTARIGDPTGKNKSRPPLTPEQVEKNAITYINQLSKIIDTDKIKIRHNSEWLEKMSLTDTIFLLAQMTLAQILQRTDFNNRYTNGIPISLHELIYPLLQGKDSVMINADIEIGGTDQLFNCMVGKQLQEMYDERGQGVICMPLLKGIDGSIKMSKSENNYIGLTDSPNDMYGKAMSIPDELLIDYITLITNYTDIEKQNKIEQLKNSTNPMVIKKEIAFNMVEIYHGKISANNAQTYFYNQVQNKNKDSKEYTLIEIPQELKNIKVSIIDLCHLLKPNESRSQIRRLVSGGGIEINNIKISDPNFIIDKLTDNLKIKIGKRNYYEFKS